MKACFYFFILFLSFRSLAQEQAKLDPSYTSTIHDKRVVELLSKHITLNEALPGIEGYRVQIFFNSGNNSRETAIKIKTDFMTKYPDINIYMLWQQPFYKIRVGDFRNRLEAQGLLDQLKNDYKDAFIVKDKIAFPEIDNRTH